MAINDKIRFLVNIRKLIFIIDLNNITGYFLKKYCLQRRKIHKEKVLHAKIYNG